MYASVVLVLAAASGAAKDYEFVSDAERLKADAVKDLVADLADPKKGREAAQRLVRFGRSAVGPLVAASRSKKLQVRFYAATVLDIIGGAAGTEAMLERLADEEEDPIVRSIAARAMGRADHAPATPVLLGLARAHAALSAPDTPEDAAHAGEAPASTAREKVSAREPDRPDVLGLNEEFRFEVMRALAYIGPGEADDLLTASLADPSARIRKVAAEGLGDHRVVAALGPLREMLGDADGVAAAAAARAISKIGKLASSAVPDLIAALDRKDVRVRRAVIGALALTTGRSFRTPQRWQKWWKDKHVPARSRTAAAEEDFPLPAVIASEILRDRPADRQGKPRTRGEGDAPPPALRMPWEDEDKDAGAGSGNVTRE